MQIPSRNSWMGEQAMAGATEVGGDRVLLAERTSSDNDKIVISQSNTLREFYADGIAGLIVNSSVVKVDFYTNDIIYDDQEVGFTSKENRLITNRMVMPISQFIEFTCSFISQIDFKGLEEQRQSLTSFRDKLSVVLSDTKPSQP